MLTWEQRKVLGIKPEYEYIEFNIILSPLENENSNIMYNSPTFWVDVAEGYGRFDALKPPSEFYPYEFVGYKYNNFPLTYSRPQAWLNTNNNKLVFENLFNDDNFKHIYPEKVIYRKQKGI